MNTLDSKQIDNGSFLVFLNVNEDLSRLTTNETISDLSFNCFSVVGPQKTVSKKTVII